MFCFGNDGSPYGLIKHKEKQNNHGVTDCSCSDLSPCFGTHVNAGLIAKIYHHHHHVKYSFYSHCITINSTWPSLLTQTLLSCMCTNSVFVLENPDSCTPSSSVLVRVATSPYENWLMLKTPGKPRDPAELCRACY